MPRHQPNIGGHAWHIRFVVYSNQKPFRDPDAQCTHDTNEPPCRIEVTPIVLSTSSPFLSTGSTRPSVALTLPQAPGCSITKSTRTSPGWLSPTTNWPLQRTHRCPMVLGWLQPGISGSEPGSIPTQGAAVCGVSVKLSWVQFPPPKWSCRSASVVLKTDFGGRDTRIGPKSTKPKRASVKRAWRCGRVQSAREANG